MDDLRDMLRAKAQTVIPGESYNSFRLEHQADDGVQVLHFEDVVTPEAPRSSLVERIVPALVRFLERKKQSLDHPRHVVVALFMGDVCFVLGAEAVLDLFCELEGTSREALRFRARSWIS